MNQYANNFLNLFNKQNTLSQPDVSPVLNQQLAEPPQTPNTLQVIESTPNALVQGDVAMPSNQDRFGFSASMQVPPPQVPPQNESEKKDILKPSGKLDESETSSLTNASLLSDSDTSEVKTPSLSDSSESNVKQDKALLTQKESKEQSLSSTSTTDILSNIITPESDLNPVVMKKNKEAPLTNDFVDKEEIAE